MQKAQGGNKLSLFEEQSRKSVGRSRVREDCRGSMHRRNSFRELKTGHTPAPSHPSSPSSSFPEPYLRVSEFKKWKENEIQGFHFINEKSEASKGSGDLPRVTGSLSTELGRILSSEPLVHSVST